MPEANRRSSARASRFPRVKVSTSAPALALALSLLSAGCGKHEGVPRTVCPTGQTACGLDCFDVTADP